ncbi:2-methylisocitrate lyase-like PEP mutase family enzyme [Labedaea rhizosphaerae]|uniref:2-methylisocitrate lyase-like PEP mutase family enzyme n=1 Tax=Labedaea rhizosphaerae TaxID=598644 RepID=A0A4R6SFT0_LABRH|nr:2-methylisocitrate lyase-like PEP mutase family enzyme [Labedaea rhizosphaerae]
MLPNAWDFASGAALVDAGFAAVGTTSLGVAAAAGLPDGEGLVRAETIDLARKLSRLPVPVTVDVESGFGGGPDEVAALALELVDAGAAGLNLEDSRPGGTLAEPARQVELISAVKAAAPSLFLNARVDTHWLGVAEDSTMDRVVRYAEAGADGVFVPGLPDSTAIRAVADAVELPLNVLYQPGRHTVAELADLGVCRISTGSLPFRVALHAGVRAALAARDDASPGPAFSYPEVQAMTTRHSLRTTTPTTRSPGTNP